MKRVCVYCGSSYGKLPAYTEAAKALGKAMTDRGIGLVYGGASVGIMGVIADSVLEGGGEVIGVIPQAIADKEIAHTSLTTLEVVPNMHERKALMAEHADGFIALPGGLGTMEELFEVWTWAQLGFHQKPCGLMNVAGYYDHLTAFIDHAVDQEYVKAAHQDNLLVSTEPADLIEKMVNYKAVPGGKWIGADVPEWLSRQIQVGALWNSREQLEQDRGSAKFQSLQQLLIDSSGLQVSYLFQRLDGALPKMLLGLEPQKRDRIIDRFYTVRASPGGLYPLVDYVNFKGEGTVKSESHNRVGWGLLQVLELMEPTPVGADALKEFANAADLVLSRRVNNAPVERNEGRFLPGWRVRLQTYHQ